MKLLLGGTASYLEVSGPAAIRPLEPQQQR
jgi:hypothetical protein